MNGRLYRGTWLLVGLPLLIAAFSVTHTAPLPAPTLPASFNDQAALLLAQDLAGTWPNRSPGSPGATGAEQWLADHFAPYRLEAHDDAFTGRIPGLGRVPLKNIVRVVPGQSPQAIVVMAHRDDNGAGQGADDNASGTAALVELARTYAVPTVSSGSAPAAGVRPAHTLVFLSTDGGAFGGLGAERFATRSPYRGEIVAVLNLDAIAGPGPPRLELAGDTARSPAASLVATAAARIVEQAGRAPARPSALRQLVDLGFPYSLYEQGPFVARGIPAVTLTTAGDRPPPAGADSTGSLRRGPLSTLGRSAQAIVGSLDSGLELTQGTTSYVYLGQRFVRGWAIELVLVASLLPFLSAAIDLFARCRRRRIALAPALRSYRSRLGFWLWLGAVFLVLRLVGAWPRGAGRPLAPDSVAAGHWPLAGLIVIAIAAATGWLVVRDRLLPRRPVSVEDELAGHAATLLVLGVLALLVVAINPFALVFVLPSLHAWLWLPQVREAHAAARTAVLLAGLAGPALLLGSLAFRYGLGLDAPWYLAALFAVGYVQLPPVVLALGWLAAAGQLAALASGRYAPYPEAAERPPRGPLRQIVRALVLAGRRRRAPERRLRALEG